MKTYDILELGRLNAGELADIANELGLDTTGLHRETIKCKILEKQAELSLLYLGNGIFVVENKNNK